MDHILSEYAKVKTLASVESIEKMRILELASTCAGVMEIKC